MVGFNIVLYNFIVFSLKTIKTLKFYIIISLYTIAFKDLL
jgi:hypothetical protein